MKNETSVVATEVCRLWLEVPVLGSEQDVSAGLSVECSVRVNATTTEGVDTRVHGRSDTEGPLSATGA